MYNIHTHTWHTSYVPDRTSALDRFCQIILLGSHLPLVCCVDWLNNSHKRLSLTLHSTKVSGFFVHNPTHDLNNKSLDHYLSRARTIAVSNVHNVNVPVSSRFTCHWLGVLWSQVPLARRHTLAQRKCSLASFTREIQFPSVTRTILWPTRSSQEVWDAPS